MDGVSFGRTRDVPLAAQIVQEVLRGLSGPVDVVVVELPRPDLRSLRTPSSMTRRRTSALVPSVDAMVLLAGSGICDLAGASAIVEHLIQACSDVWLCLRTRGKSSHVADPVAGAFGPASSGSGP